MEAKCTTIECGCLQAKNFKKSKFFSSKFQKSKTQRKAQSMQSNQVTDVRRTYTHVLINSFNSCDLDKLRNTYENYCTPDVVSTSIYDGDKNPYAAKSTEIKSIESHISLWASLFKSAPDFLFEITHTEAYLDKASNLCIIKSKFIWNGTRILDVKVAERANGLVMREKLQNKDKVVFLLLWS